MNVIIVGGGIAGLSTAWALAGRGHKVTLFEQGVIPNPLAASGDHHRIIRRAYPAASGYAPLITEAFTAWEALWADLGATHYDARGFAMFSQVAGDEADIYRAGLDDGGFDYEEVGEAEWQARFPFINRAPMRWGVVSPEGGVLHCRKIASGLRDWLFRAGVEIRENTPVSAIHAEAGRVQTADGARFSADCIVVAAGGWAAQLLPALADVLTVHRTAVTYVEPPAAMRAAWAASPVLLDLGSTLDAYIIPPSGEGGLKFGTGRHKVRARNGDAGADRTPRPREGEEILAHFRDVIHDIDAYAVQSTVTCAYTFTADENFTAERFGKVIAVSACSGHGYKFGAAVGRRAAMAVETGDIAAFKAWLAPARTG